MDKKKWRPKKRRVFLSLAVPFVIAHGFLAGWLLWNLANVSYGTFIGFHYFVWPVGVIYVALCAWFAGVAVQRGWRATIVGSFALVIGMALSVWATLEVKQYLFENHNAAQHRLSK